MGVLSPSSCGRRQRRRGRMGLLGTGSTLRADCSRRAIPTIQRVAALAIAAQLPITSPSPARRCTKLMLHLIGWTCDGPKGSL